MPYQAVLAKLKQVIKSDKLFLNPERFLEGLLSVNALRLGAKIQCPVCTRYNWYQLNTLDYELHCRFCLSDYSPPLKSPKDIKWTYRAHGPFAGSVAQGAFTVLLTLRLLEGGLNQSITPIFSYIAEKDGKHLEADLTCLYKRSTWQDKAIYIVHAECKSFNKFESKDIDRMKNLASSFPSSVLIFATLRNALDELEVKMIKNLVVFERTKILKRKLGSQIIVLTGTELYADRLEEAWKDKGGLYIQFSQRPFELTNLNILADATQQLYLKLPSLSKWLEVERKKRHR